MNIQPSPIKEILISNPNPTLPISTTHQFPPLAQMPLTATTALNCKVYNVTGKGQSSLPEWLVKKNKKSLKKDPEWTQRIDLIQDLAFPQACTRLRATPDAKFLIATGTYKPQIRFWDLEELAMKFDRHTSTDTVQFQILGQDWKKIALLQADRYIELHTPFGLHFSTRIPRFGRDLAYHPRSCDLFAVGASNEAWRLNLEQGTFLKPLSTALPSINCVKIAENHDLCVFGGENGQAEFWDHRYRHSIGTLDVVKGAEISALSFIDDITVAVGTSSGIVSIWDLRRGAPIVQKDHQYGMPIKSICHDPVQDLVISADTKSVKLWNRQSGKAFSYLEPSADINEMILWPGSGLLMLGCEDRQVQSFFIPSLGPAPKWCSFLESLTEELEESATPAIYDNYKFVTLQELQNLGLEHLLGTDNIKAYMHGYFVEVKVWKKAFRKAASKAQAFDQIKEEQLKREFDSKAASRVGLVDGAMPLVNRALAQKLSEQAVAPEDQKKKKRATGLLKDARFGALFANPDFAIDEESDAFKLINPSTVAATSRAEASEDEVSEEEAE